LQLVGLEEAGGEDAAAVGEGVFSDLGNVLQVDLAARIGQEFLQQIEIMLTKRLTPSLANDTRSRGWFRASWTRGPR
jgi:hypothetical protein